MLLGDIIKEYRSEHNMSMQTFADLIKGSKGYVSMLEKNYNPSTKKPISPSLDTLKLIAEAMKIDLDTLLKMLDDDQKIILNEEKYKEQFKAHYTKIPILNSIKADIPITQNKDITKYENITDELAKKGDFFALIVKDDTMEPTLKKGDIAILLVQSKVKNGEVGAVILNNNGEVTLKRIYNDDTGIILIPDNLSNKNGITPIHYTNKEIKEIPIRITGKLMEVRKKYY